MIARLGTAGGVLRVGDSPANYARVGSDLAYVAPVLDVYPGASAAYSLRRLRYDYTGPVVQVRRSSDNAEEVFTVGEIDDGTLAAWVGEGNDGYVKQWYDQTGNGNHMEQSTADSQPKLVASGVVNTDSDGDRYLIHIGDTMESAAFSTSESAGEVLAVVDIDTGGSGFGNCVYGYGGNGYALIVSGAGFLSIERGNSLYPSSIAVGVDDKTKTLTGHSRLSATSLQLFYGPSTSSVSVPDVDYSTLRLGQRSTGSGDVLNGKYYELIVYDGDYSSSRAGIKANIGAHYSL